MKNWYFGIILFIVFLFGCASSAKNSDGNTLEQAIKEATEEIDNSIENGSKIAILNFSSTSEQFSAYVIGQLETNLVRSRHLAVTDRQQVDLRRSELEFQMSGEVDDNTMQSLGKTLGAEYIISGSLQVIGGIYHITIRVLNVQTGQVLVRYPSDIIANRRVLDLLADSKTSGTTTASGSQATQIPNWVRTLPQNTDNMTFFVGKSEKMENYENYLEAKAGALADILMQFSIFKGAEVQQMTRDYQVGSEVDQSKILSFKEDMATITTANSCIGLFQQAEWMVDDGTLYVLYTYSSVARTNPIPDFPVFFKNHLMQNNRIYFTAMSVSSTHIDSQQAEQNAKMQALLWSGANITSLFRDYSAKSEDDPGSNSSFFEAGIKCTSTVNFQSLSFQEESRHIHTENGKNYFYGLYSISTARRPSNIAEYECFSYYASSGDDTLTKSININGNLFNRDKPYTVAHTRNTTFRMPQSINNAVINVPRNAIVGVGRDRNSSFEIQNLRASVLAIAEISIKMNAWVQEMIRDYTVGSDTNAETTLSFIEPMTVALSKSNLIGAFKTHDVLSEDNSSWHVWQLGK